MYEQYEAQNLPWTSAKARARRWYCVCLEIEAERLARTERLRLHVLDGLAADEEEDGVIDGEALTVDSATLTAALDGVAAAEELG